MRSRWYQYSQNNSGGEWMGPAFEVYIEAHSPKNADNRAQRVGVHFDGVYWVAIATVVGIDGPAPLTLAPIHRCERFQSL